MKLLIAAAASIKTRTKGPLMKVKKTPVAMKERAGERAVSNDTQRPKDPLANVLTTKPKPLSDDVSPTRPKNPPSNVRPTEGYILEVDGKFKSEFESSEAAMKAGLELKTKYPQIQVKVYDAKERTRTLVNLPE
jgi:hypothetical protein